MPFHDPIAPKQKVNGDKRWSFKAPSKDVSHSGELSAGNDYGVGFRTPVGKERGSSMAAGPIPQKNKCWNPDETIKASKRG